MSTDVFCSSISAHATMSPGKSIECEYFDMNECSGENGKQCNQTKTTCEEPEAGKRVHCYALWRNDSGVFELEKKVKRKSTEARSSTNLTENQLVTRLFSKLLLPLCPVSFTTEISFAFVHRCGKTSASFSLVLSTICDKMPLQMLQIFVPNYTAQKNWYCISVGSHNYADNAVSSLISIHIQFRCRVVGWT